MKGDFEELFFCLFSLTRLSVVRLMNGLIAEIKSSHRVQSCSFIFLLWHCSFFARGPKSTKIPDFTESPETASDEDKRVPGIVLENKSEISSIIVLR